MASAKVIVAIDIEGEARLVDILQASSEGTRHFLVEDYREGGGWDYKGEVSPGIYTADIAITEYRSSNPECPEVEVIIHVDNFMPLLDLSPLQKEWAEKSAVVGEPVPESLEDIIKELRRNV